MHFQKPRPSFSLEATSTSNLVLLQTLQSGQASQAMEQLTMGGANPNGRDPTYGWTALHLAIRDNKLALAEALLQRGAHVDARDLLGQTPLHRAAFWGHHEGALLLLQHGADFTACDDVMQSPEMVARNQGKGEVAQLLAKCREELMRGEGCARPSRLPYQFSEEELLEMRRAVRHGEQEEKKRAVLWKRFNQLEERRGREKEKEAGKAGIRMERLEGEIDKVAEEILKLQLLIFSSPSSGAAVCKESLRKKKLEEKKIRMEAKLEGERLKVLERRRKSLKGIPVEAKADRWIDFINS